MSSTAHHVNKKGQTGAGGPQPRRFTVEEYYKMADAGVLRDHERLELIEGEIIVLSPQGPKHAAGGNRAGDVLRRMLGDRALVREQYPIHLADNSEPEPDIVVAFPDENYYADHHPTPREILLVMEVSDTTLEFDRVRKARMYARAGITQYCLINVQAREIEEFRQPKPDGYRARETFTARQTFTLAAMPGVTINVGDLLPPAKKTTRLKRKSK
ncbi:MAG: Uma2 family endonuclease [Blastocatellia bacterium]